MKCHFNPFPNHASTRGRSRSGVGVKHHERGVVLLAAIAVLVLLAISSTAYLQLATVDRQIGLQSEIEFDLVQSAMVSKVKTILIDDMSFNDNNYFDNKKDWWDYPYTNGNATQDVELFDGTIVSSAKGGEWDDTWLASTVMDFDLSRNGRAGGEGVWEDMGWRHISNVEGIFLRVPRPMEASLGTSDTKPEELVVDFSGTGEEAVLHTDTDIEYQYLLADKRDLTGVADTLIAGIDGETKADATTDNGGTLPLNWYWNFDITGDEVNDNDPVAIYEPLGVDADGDGVVDSRWTWAPIRSYGAYNYVCAYRIVDLSSLLPISAATALTDHDGNYNEDNNRGYHPGYQNMMPFLVQTLDTGGNAFISTESHPVMEAILERQGYEDTEDVDAQDGIQNGLTHLRANNKARYTDGANENDGEDRYFHDPSTTYEWYADSSSFIENPLELWSKRTRYWGINSDVAYTPYGGATVHDTYELLHRFGLNRTTYKTDVEDDLDEYARSDVYETDYSAIDSIATAMDTRGKLMRWFIGEGVTNPDDQDNPVAERNFYDIRKMLTTISGGMQVTSPVNQNQSNVNWVPKAAYSLDQGNMQVDKNYDGSGVGNHNAFDGLMDDFQNLGPSGSSWSWWTPDKRVSYHSNSDYNNWGGTEKRLFRRALRNNISDYIDSDGAPGRDENNDESAAAFGFERLPHLGEVYLHYKYTKNGTNYEQDTTDYLYVFELRNPFMHPIRVTDLFPNNDERGQWKIRVTMNSPSQRYDTNSIFSDPEYDADRIVVRNGGVSATAEYLTLASSDILIPPMGTTFFYAQPGTATSESNLILNNLPTTDSYGQKIWLVQLTQADTSALEGYDAVYDPNGADYTGENANGRLFVQLQTSCEDNDAELDGMVNRTYDRISHQHFRLYNKYPTDDVEADGTDRFLQMSIARDGRGLRFLMNPYNKNDANQIVKKKLPSTTGFVTTDDEAVSALIDANFCYVDNLGGLQGGNVLVHQMGQHEKDRGDGNPIEIAVDNGTRVQATIDAWKESFDDIQIANPGHPIISAMELALISPWPTAEGRAETGSDLTNSKNLRPTLAEMLGDADAREAELFSSNPRWINPRMLMWRMDREAAFEDFTVSASVGDYLGSLVTQAPPIGILMDSLDVMALGADGLDNNGDGQFDNDADMVVPYRININTAPRHIMTMACPLPEDDVSVEMLFRQIERYRDGADETEGTALYDGVNSQLGSVADVRSAMTGLPADAFKIDGARAHPGVKSLSELLWMNPSEYGDTSQDPSFFITKYSSTVASGTFDDPGHVSWADMQRFAFDNENNADEEHDIYPADFDRSLGSMSSDLFKASSDITDTDGNVLYRQNDIIDAGIDDNEERLHRYQFLTGTYTTRSDFYVLYGFIRAYSGDDYVAGPEGSRRFMAVIDRHRGMDGVAKVVGGSLVVK